MKEILSKCKCGVFFTANEHRDYYESAEEWLVNQMPDQPDIDEIGKDVWDKMIETDTVYSLQFYPDTPIGSYKIYHYDYDELLKKAKDILNESR
jgi:Holliday junction resolvase RusA-like endonuclease